MSAEGLVTDWTGVAEGRGEHRRSGVRGVGWIGEVVMGEARRKDAEPSSLSALRQVDEVCERFEAAWQAAGGAGEQPRIEEYLAGTAGRVRSELLRELLRLELAYRGERP